MGGEKAQADRPDHARLGSPPRGRGKVQDYAREVEAQRITPAWAGKRYLPPYLCSGSWDHPRVGGEKHLRDKFLEAFLGSPPHGRGKGLGLAVNVLGDGITPAWAGKRTRSWRAYGCPWDHPRVGGEKIWAARLAVASRGSPPRGRGKAWHLSHGLLPCG